MHFIRRRRRGATLVEVLIALGCLALGLLAMSQGLAASIGQTAERVAAAIRAMAAVPGSPSGVEGSHAASYGENLPSAPGADAADPAQDLGNIQLVGWHDDQQPHVPGLPPMPGGGGPGTPPSTAPTLILGGAAMGCVAGGGLALAGVVTSVAAPVACAGGAAAGALLGTTVAIGQAAAPALQSAWQSVGEGIGNLFGGDDDAAEGGESEHAEQSVDDYVKGLEKKTTPNNTEADMYERAVAGDTNYQLQGNGEKVWADGVDANSKSAVEAKYIDKPDDSPFIEGSNFYTNPKPWQQNLLDSVDDEFRRYGATLSDPNVPLKELIVKVSDEDAIPFFDRLMTKYNVPGKIVVEEPAYWYGN